MAKKRRSARLLSIRSRRNRLGVNLKPILAVVTLSIRKLERQLATFEDDPKKIQALKRSIQTLQAVYDKTRAICPSEITWFGVSVRGTRRGK